MCELGNNSSFDKSVYCNLSTHYKNNRDRNKLSLLVHNCCGKSDQLLHSKLFSYTRSDFTGAINECLELFPP